MDKEEKIPNGAGHWKSTIMGINDRKILNYIQDLVRIRLDHADADERLNASDKRMKSNMPTHTSSYQPPKRKLKPLNLGKSVDEENLY